MRLPAHASALVVAILTAGFLAGQEVDSKNPVLLKATSGKLPITFIENRGVYPDEVKYYIQGADKTLFFTKKGITFRLKGKDKGWIVKLAFVMANPAVEPRGENRQQAVFSYFKGPEKDWKTGLPTFSRVVYMDLWPGIDLVYKGTVNKLKYEFVVKPGADPGRIRLRYQGATSVAPGKDGALWVETPQGGFEDEVPVAWQEISGRRVPVEMRYRLGNGEEFGFDIGGYDRTMPLILDPAILVYCGYLGGASSERGYSIAVDGAGSAYVTGETSSGQLTFPVKVGPDLTHNGLNDAFVAKVNAQGTGLVYCGYIGGASGARGFGIAVDSAGSAYVTGETSSDQLTFPVKVGPDLTHNGLNDAFVAKVNPQGTGLVYCGYIGGANGDEVGCSIAVDGAGSAYVTGRTGSDQLTFPVKLGPDLTYNGGIDDDAFVAKVNAQGTGLVYCGYIGGASGELGWGIAVDGAGNAYVTGQTYSHQQTFPVNVGPDLTLNGNYDAFVAKVNAQGTGLVYCGYIGGAGRDWGAGIAVDRAGNAYVTGAARSDQLTFPVKVGPGLTFSGGLGDAFVSKVNVQGTGLDYCGYIGGASDEWGSAIAVDGAGNAYVTGATGSDQQTFPVKAGPDLTYNGGYNDAFVVKVDPQGLGLIYCGYIGGSVSEAGGGIAVDGAGSAYVTGETDSGQQTFPVKVGPDLTSNGSVDAFVAKVSLTVLRGSGAPRPGGTVALTLLAPEGPGLPYQLGSSLGLGPIPIDRRKIGLDLDGLLVISVNGYWPHMFSGYRGLIDGKSQARAAVNIPSIAALIGVWLHTAFVTLDPLAPSGIRSISNTFSFTITK